MNGEWTPGEADVKEPVLRIRDLRTHIGVDGGVVRAVDGVDLAVGRGETLCLVGESGSGKSVAARSVMRLLVPSARIVTGEILFSREPEDDPVDLARLDPRGPAMRAVRGAGIGMVFQEPMSSLSPVHTVGDQVAEMALTHSAISKREAREQAAQMLDHVGITQPRKRLDDYPFQLSGGMRQRVMIAMALMCNPALLIADEPTTALDVTTQAQILDLLRRIQDEHGMAILFITHDMGVVAEMAERVAVMYLGRVVETGGVTEIFDAPRHPYTRAMLASIPSIGGARGGELPAITGSVPPPLHRPRGCSFHPRCAVAVAGRCDEHAPPRIDLGDGHWMECVHGEESR
ncbi:ABC transporter ATP-binding protein [Pseudonocardia zijingensis]|jgi:oligopeptide/dipeptide ABC transporter ATP-binding protein|uniref:ABC transporter ATP-binding protein n=1 Tax=Pseudonocardia zijingensis TaxID=153376 RepID=A0ABN1QM68_9PSEU